MHEGEVNRIKVLCPESKPKSIVVNSGVPTEGPIDCRRKPISTNNEASLVILLDFIAKRGQCAILVKDEIGTSRDKVAVFGQLLNVDKEDIEAKVLDDAILVGGDLHLLVELVEVQVCPAGSRSQSENLGG